MIGRLTFGIALILFGVGLLLDRMGVLDFWGLVNLWWPLVIIAFGLAQLFRRSVSILGAAIFILLGILLQAQRLDMLPASLWSLFWPAVLILVGIWLMLSRSRAHSAGASTEQALNEFVLFGGINPRNQSQSFKGGSVTAFFGGAEIDLRGANLAPEGAHLDLTAAFGGIELIVPASWRVKVSGLPIFGGLSNKTSIADEAPSVPSLEVSVFALFGGAEVHN